MEGCYSYGGLRRLLSYSLLKQPPATPFGFAFICAKGGTHVQRASLQPNFRIFYLKTASQALTFTCAFPREQFGGMLQLLVDDKSSKTSDHQINTASTMDKKHIEDITERSNRYLHDVDEIKEEEANSGSESAQNSTEIFDSEIQRRRKIGVANKGRTPWNKGRKHSEETQELIKKRTIEALSDPKVRKKMSECPRYHSEQSKTRISIAQKRNWDKRLKNRKLQEKWYAAWARSIAEAAKKGGYDQQELGWNSYEEMKADIMSQYLQWKADKVRDKEIAKLRAERVAKLRAENMARLAEHKEIAKLRAERVAKLRAEKMARLAEQREEKKQMTNAKKSRASVQKSRVEKSEMAISKGLKLKERLTKFHQRRKQIESSISISKEMVNKLLVIEKWEIEQIKQEKMRQRISLADQIQAVKNRKADFAVMDVPIGAFSNSFIENKAGDV